MSLTAVYQTGVSSSNPRQSHRVHPVHEAKKPHAPAGHRRPEEAERTAGATRYFTLSRCQFVLHLGDTLHEIYADYATKYCFKNLISELRTSVLVWDTLQNWHVEILLLIILTLFLRSCFFFMCSCSPSSGEGEGLHPTPGQLLVAWQQPVHQSQRQRRVGVRRRLRLELRVGARGAAQQEEAPRGGQLESWAVQNLAKVEAAGHQGRARGYAAFKALEAHLPLPPHANNSHPWPPSPPSSFSLSLLHLWVGSHWRLMTPQTSSHRRHNRLSSHPISKNRREEVSRVEDDCFNPARELQVFFPFPSLPFSLFFVSPSLVFPPLATSTIQNPKRGSLAT